MSAVSNSFTVAREPPHSYKVSNNLSSAVLYRLKSSAETSINVDADMADSADDLSLSLLFDVIWIFPSFPPSTHNLFDHVHTMIDYPPPFLLILFLIITSNVIWKYNFKPQS